MSVQLCPNPLVPVALPLPVFNSVKDTVCVQKCLACSRYLIALLINYSLPTSESQLFQAINVTALKTWGENSARSVQRLVLRAFEM